MFQIQRWSQPIYKTLSPAWGCIQLYPYVQDRAKAQARPKLSPSPRGMGFYIGLLNLGLGLDKPRLARPIFGTGLDNPCLGPARPINSPRFWECTQCLFYVVCHLIYKEKLTYKERQYSLASSGVGS